MKSNFLENSRTIEENYPIMSLKIMLYKIEKLVVKL